MALISTERVCHAVIMGFTATVTASVILLLINEMRELDHRMNEVEYKQTLNEAGKCDARS